MADAHATPETIDIIAPDDGQDGTKAAFRGWLVTVGAAVRADQPVAELETDKVTVEIPAPASGVLTEALVAPGDAIAPGQALGRLQRGEAQAPAASIASDPTRNAVTTTAAANGAPLSPKRATLDPERRLSPAVRRLVAAHDLDLGAIQGSGRGGRISYADAKAALDAPRPTSMSAPVSAAAALPVAAAPSSGLPSQLIPHDRMRRLIADNMVRSVTIAPHVTAVIEADLSAIVAHRAAHKATFAQQGVPLTYTAYFVAAAVRAMSAAPTVNSRWHDDALEVFQDVNIGVGAALGDNGLIVPVIHQAQTLNLLGIAARLQDLTTRARDGRLAVADTKNGTFTISNHGVSGSLIAAPVIINQPQSAILGLGKMEKRVVVVQDASGADMIAIRPMAFVSLTIDHRALDGHQTNAWLTRFSETLQTWA